MPFRTCFIHHPESSQLWGCTGSNSSKSKREAASNFLKWQASLEVLKVVGRYVHSIMGPRSEGNANMYNLLIYRPTLLVCLAWHHERVLASTVVLWCTNRIVPGIAISPERLNLSRANLWMIPNSNQHQVSMLELSWKTVEIIILKLVLKILTACGMSPNLMCLHYALFWRRNFRANSVSLQSTSLCVALTAKMGVKQKIHIYQKRPVKSCLVRNNATQRTVSPGRGGEKTMWCVSEIYSSFFSRTLFLPVRYSHQALPLSRCSPDPASKQEDEIFEFCYLEGNVCLLEINSIFNSELSELVRLGFGGECVVCAYNRFWNTKLSKGFGCVGLH